MQGPRGIVREDAVLHDQIGHRGFGMLDEQRIVPDAQPHDDVEVGPVLREQARLGDGVALNTLLVHGSFRYSPTASSNSSRGVRVVMQKLGQSLSR